MTTETTVVLILIVAVLIAVVVALFKGRGFDFRTDGKSVAVKVKEQQVEDNPDLAVAKGLQFEGEGRDIVGRRAGAGGSPESKKISVGEGAKIKGKIRDIVGEEINGPSRKEDDDDSQADRT